MTTIKAETKDASIDGVLHTCENPGYQTPSLFFSDGVTIKPRPKAHKPADSGAVVGNGARLCSLRECLEMSVKHLRLILQISFDGEGA
jgi:hypothetical protein